MLPADWYIRARLKLRHLQLLSALDDHRNLARAALSLRVTQPAASKLLAEIEGMVATSLFERLPRGMEPNLFGEILIRRARSVLIELEGAAKELAATRAGAAGQVSIGAVSGPAAGPVVRAIERVRQTRPGMSISVQVETSGPLVARLLEGRLDFAVARIPPGIDASALDYREMADEEIGLFVRASHPILQGPPPDLAALAGQAWVLQPPGTLLRRRIEGLFRAAHLAPPREVISTEGVMMSLSLIDRIDAVTALSRAAAGVLTRPGGRFRLLGHIPGTGRIAIDTYGLVRLAERPLSPAAAALYQAVEDELRPAAPRRRRP